MIIFLLFTIIAWLANACLVKILFISIQQGQWLDKLLNWQERLRRWDLRGKEFLVKAGGMCELCFSHAVTFISFWAYMLVANEVLTYWITTPVSCMLPKVIVNVIWYLVYVSIGTNLSLYFISKMYKSES